MAGSLASINIKFFADLKQFSTQMQNAERSMKKYGQSMTKVGSSLTVGLTAPLTAFAAVSLKSWNDQEKAIAQLNAGLKSTGNAVGYTTEQLQAMASELQNNTLFGDEDILKNATAQLLTFTNIAGEQFGRTQQAALDLATRLDGDLKSASIQLGKALNDPVANLSALSRSGIQFSEDQKAMINSLVETNQLADAQTLILNELEKQYGGSAAAAAAAGTGPLKQLSNILGDISEDFGAIIGEAIQPFVAKLKEWAIAFKNLSPEVKKTIAIVGSLAAAIGPILVALGFLMTTVIPGLVTAFGALSAPILAVVAAIAGIAYVIYENWGPIKQALVDIANYFIDLYNESTAFRIAVQGVILSFKNMWTILKGVGRLIMDTFKSMGTTLKAALTLDWDLYKKGSADFAAAIEKNFEDTTSQIGDNFKTALENVGKRTKIVLTADSIDTTAVEGKVASAISSPGGSSNFNKDAFKNVRGNSGAFGALALEVGRNDFSNIGEDLYEAGNEVENFEEKMTAFQGAVQQIGGSVGNVFSQMGQNIVTSLGLADEGFQGFVKGMVSTITQLIAMMLASSISQSIAGATASGTATGPAAVFATPAFIATAVGGVLAAFAAIPKFATGGIVGGSSYHGDKVLARLNSGEMVLNTDQQRNLYNATSGSVVEVPYIASTFVSGSDMKLVLKRQDKKDSRTQ